MLTGDKGRDHSCVQSRGTASENLLRFSDILYMRNTFRRQLCKPLNL